MKRWWWILAIIAVFFVGDRIGAALIARLMERSPQRFCRLYAGDLQGEIACLGNSRGVVDLHAPSIAEATGKSAVNISHNGMTSIVAQAIADDYLERCPKPQLLVIEVSFVTAETTEGGVGEYMPFWGRSQRLHELGEEYCHKEVVAGDVTRLYRFNSELCLRSLIYLARGQSDQGAGMNATLSSTLVEETKHLAPFELEILSPELAALAATVDAARKAGVEVRLVFAPYLPTYAEKISNLDAVVAAISEKTGARVYDFSRAVENIDLFADRVHMNPAGSRKFTQLMVDAGVFAPVESRATPSSSVAPTADDTK